MFHGLFMGDAPRSVPRIPLKNFLFFSEKCIAICITFAIIKSGGAKMKERKKASITFRLQPVLKQRFEKALQREGITQSQFFVAKILEFCEESERREKDGDNT
jgi:hypothetical protein